MQPLRAALCVSASLWFKLLLLIAIGVGAAPRVFAQDWKVGLAQVKITPDMPLPLSGYGGRAKPFTKVAGDLYAKAMVLADTNGNRGVIVTTDLLGLSAEIAEPICARIEKKTRLKREQILLNSSHTHAGPLLTLKAPTKGEPGEAFRSVEYTRQLQERIVDVVAQAVGRLEPARLSWGGGIIDFSMNRREFTPKGVILGVNPRGLADRGVPVLRVDGADGKLRAVLFGAAVHGTTLTGENYELCGDFAGFAQQYLGESFPGVQAMYMIGCAGDNNPYPRGTMELTRKHGKALAEEVARVLAGKLRPVRGPLRVGFDRPKLPLQPVPARAELEKLAKDKRSPQTWGAGQMLAALDRGEKLPTEYPCPVAVWQFGKDLTLVGLSGEVVVDYVTAIERAIGPNQLWIAAYCNDVFGYLPSARVLDEGGYETRGLYAGGAGFFDARAEGVLVERVRELAKRGGR